MWDLSSVIVAIDGLLSYKDYSDRKPPKSKQLVMDDKNRGKFKKHMTMGSASLLGKLFSNRVIVVRG